MFNIRFMGKFKDEDVLKQRPLPAGAVPYQEGGLEDVIRKGFRLALPMLTVMFTIGILRYLQVRERMPGKPVQGFRAFFDALTLNATELGVVNLVITVIMFLGLNFMLTILHELIHAVTVPARHEKQIWSHLDKGVLFVFFPEPVSRARFIVVSLAPNIVLAFVPWILLMVYAADLSTQAYWWIFIQVMLMAVGGIGDYANTFHTLTQVPKNGRVHSYGVNSYWTADRS